MLVVVDASPQSLATIAAVRAELGLVDSSQDSKIEGWIAQASAAIASSCNRVFCTEDVEETVRLNSFTCELILSRDPIVEIDSIIEDGVVLSEAEYELDARLGILTRLRGDRPACWHGKIIVSYTAGYDDLPADVVRACIQLVKGYAASGDRDPSIRSETLESLGATTYFADAIPPEVDGLLAAHRKPAIG